MPAKKDAEPVFITAEALAAEVGRNGKTLRGFLRKNFARAAEQKGGRWAIDEVTAEAVRAHYAALDAPTEAAS